MLLPGSPDEGEITPCFRNRSTIPVPRYRRQIMKKLVLLVISLMISATAASPVFADFDKYPGDSSIYGVESTTKPNVLIVIDNSGSMADTVIANDYLPSTTYATSSSCTSQPGVGKTCVSDQIYRKTGTATYTLIYGSTTASSRVWVCDRTNRDGTCGSGHWDTTNVTTYYPLHLSQVPATCGTLSPLSTMTNEGIYIGYQLSPQASSTATATCTTGGTTGYTYVTGNYVNYTKSPQYVYKQKIAIARDVVKNLIKTTEGVNFGLMTYFYTPSCDYTSYNSCAQGGTFISKSVAFGSSTGTYVSTIKEMDTIFPTGNSGNAACIDTSKCTNRDALMTTVDTLTSAGATPLAETMLEAGRYFSGGAPAFGATVGVSSGKYTTPVVSTCQKNYVIFVTDGMSTADDSAVLRTIGTSGDTDGDGNEPGDLSHSLDDVAKYLNTSAQNIVSYYIGFDLSGANQDAIDLLNRASDENHGKGDYYSANSQIGLSDTLSTIMSEIISVNSSYVAPVVPVSPQNRSYGSSRVYMGFFRPYGNSYWAGNLKKYALDYNNFVIDLNNNYATWVDEDNNGVDDRDGTTLETDASNGSFKSTAKSFWSTSVDGGTVKLGGAGEVLKGLTGSRHLYTYTGTNSNLTDSSNLLSSANSAITATTLGVADSTAKDNLIKFLQGYDVYLESSNSSATSARSWVMGDILHSRPLVLNYNKYTFNTTSEADSSQNKTMIFVGGNDGMLHAFNDYNGSEAWAFTPPESLDKLKDITGIYHPIFTDSSVSAYVYDANNNGTIETGDKVILIFGERRGGGTFSAATTGHYYAFDVSDPASPQYLWKVDNTTSGFAQMGESWSEPKFVKMKIGSASKIVAFFGGGYDNPNEDGRYGATQGFTGAGSVVLSETGSGAVSSSNTVAGNTPLNPRGRGLYAVELATLNSSGVPAVASSVTKIWSATNETGTPTSPNKYYSNMTFSFPAEVTAIDSDNNGYTNRIYAVDTGANLWRFDLDDPSPANWAAKMIFSANPGSASSSDVGRKVFYKPSVVTERGYRMIYFGTGDREHPLNTNVVDRIYAFKDPDINTYSTAKTESNLVDLTLDTLQNTTTTGTELTNSINLVLTQLNSSSNFGWYIKLNENSGEKALSSPTVFSKVLYLTTYSPSTATNSTSCSGNLGTARLYALDYKTGEAVLNYNEANDGSLPVNIRARDSAGKTLTRSDRVTTLGSGIPSGVVVLISAGGQTKIMTGVGGKIATAKSISGGTIIPLYWRQK